jgi:hypothetical protein
MLNRSREHPAAGNGVRRTSVPASRTALIARKGLGWIPWQNLLGRVARSYGFIDPATFLGRLRRFARPSEVGEPIELLRAGVVFHARGLINTRAIQFNLDWVWPYWVEQQFNPDSESFIPRGFSFSHINLTHRNWTAVGLPDVPHYPIVDPRGLVTPLFDGWSLDFWLWNEEEGTLLPSRCPDAEQTLEMNAGLAVRTRVGSAARRVESEVTLEVHDDAPTCVIRVRASDGHGASRLAVTARPYNPEGVSFIDSIEATADGKVWSVNSMDRVEFSMAPERTAFACHESGDVFASLHGAPAPPRSEIRCGVGMATAAALFPVEKTLEIRVPIESGESPDRSTRVSWSEAVNRCARLTIPDERLQRLYDIAVRTVILHAPGEVYPGPYTYKRFWYRDAALILNALITLGDVDRTRRALDLFPRGQLRDGYFRSQEGEWDSNGQVLWILHRYVALSGGAVPAEWLSAIENGARWIMQKRQKGPPHPGLLPAGFSAEHLGLNDFYYWDDFWGAAGLRSAEQLLANSNPVAAREFGAAGEEFLRTILASVDHALPRTGGAVPAAPDRRMDSGAVGSLVADFPLQLLPPGDPRIMQCIEWLLAHSMALGGFFQNMIHSGINAYLTLHIAQALLRADDARAHQLIDTVAGLASPTGQWPEAIHPRTRGGCMGDGQHVWAAAEWLMMMRNLFVREEGDTLILGAGIRPEWLARGQAFGIEGTLTAAGRVAVRVEPVSADEAHLHIEADWRGAVPRLDVRVPNHGVRPLNERSFVLRRIT